MKRILYTIAASMVTCSALAQITITTVPTVVPNVLDSATLPLSSGGMPSLAPMANGSWDFGSIAIQPGFKTFHYRTPTPSFSIANFADSVAYSIDPAFGISYHVWRNMQQSATGVVIPGEEILTRQAISLAGFTLNVLDSIVFPLQAIRYNNPLPVMQLPARLGSRWEATTTRDVNFLVTVTDFSLDKEPAQHRQVRRYLDSVVGWGRMRVPIPGKGSSDWIQVLQVQHSDIVLDSFFLSGMPAPDALLSGIGVTQGQTNTYPSTYFYRAGSFRPLAEAIHSGPSHSASPSAFYMHAQNLPAPVSVRTVTAMGEVSMYPNPARGGKVMVEVPENKSNDWHYTLTNIAGQRLASGAVSLSATQSVASISIPDALSAGIYYLSLSNREAQITVLPLTIE